MDPVLSYHVKLQQTAIHKSALHFFFLLGHSINIINIFRVTKQESALES